MARLTLPNAVEKRNLLHGGKTPASTLVSLGEGFESAKRLVDALDFFVKAKHDPGIDRIKAFALEHGHSFLLLRLRRIASRDVSPAEWIAAAGTAETEGRLQDALHCLQESGDAEKLAELREKLRAGATPANGAATAAAPKPPI